MPYRQLSVLAGGVPLGEDTVPETNPGGSFLVAVRDFALANPVRVEVWERHHDHMLPYPRPCLTCPPGRLIRSWNGPRPAILRSAAHEALLELDPAFRKLVMHEASDRITEVLQAFHDSGELDLYAFIKLRVICDGR